VLTAPTWSFTAAEIRRWAGGGRSNRDAVFATFVDALRARGMQSVDDVVADASLFDRNTILEAGRWATSAATMLRLSTRSLYNENVVGVVIDDCEHPLVTTDPLFVPATGVVCGTGEPSIRADCE